uniref:Uncharacterized protein n=1 Tax=Strongyloides papillosus TaxID=174720 RepID=A0A0N5BXF3_STREA
MLLLNNVVFILLFIMSPYVYCGKKQEPETHNVRSTRKKSSRRHGRGRSDKADRKRKVKDENDDKPPKKETSKNASHHSNVKEPEIKPLNEKEVKIMNNQVKADENEYPTMMDAADGFKNTPTIDNT